MSDQWWEGPLTAFDCETTGTDVWDDRIVTASVVELRPGHRPVTRSWLINSGKPSSPKALEVHGITDDHARDNGMVPAQALFEISGLLALSLVNDIPVVAFVAAFDFTILEAENKRHRQPTLIERVGKRGLSPVIDPFVIDKAKSRRKGSRKLADQCVFYGVTLAGAHSSAGDALAAARLVPVLVRTYPELTVLSLNELHKHQIAWRAEQANSLRAYFDKQNTPHDGCPTGWPLQQQPAKATT